MWCCDKDDDDDDDDDDDYGEDMRGPWVIIYVMQRATNQNSYKFNQMHKYAFQCSALLLWLAPSIGQVAHQRPTKESKMNT